MILVAQFDKSIYLFSFKNSLVNSRSILDFNTSQSIRLLEEKFEKMHHFAVRWPWLLTVIRESQSRSGQRSLLAASVNKLLVPDSFVLLPP